MKILIFIKMYSYILIFKKNVSNILISLILNTIFNFSNLVRSNSNNLLRCSRALLSMADVTVCSINWLYNSLDLLLLQFSKSFSSFEHTYKIFKKNFISKQI